MMRAISRIESSSFSEGRVSRPGHSGRMGLFPFVCMTRHFSVNHDFSELLTSSVCKRSSSTIRPNVFTKKIIVSPTVIGSVTNSVPSYSVRVMKAIPTICMITQRPKPLVCSTYSFNQQDFQSSRAFFSQVFSEFYDCRRFASIQNCFYSILLMRRMSLIPNFSQVVVKTVFSSTPYVKGLFIKGILTKGIITWLSRIKISINIIICHKQLVAVELKSRCLSWDD